MTIPSSKLLPILAAEIKVATESAKSATVESAKQYLQAGPYGPSEVPLSYFNAAGRYIRTGVTVIFNTYPSVAPSWRWVYPPSIIVFTK